MYMFDVFSNWIADAEAFMSVWHMTLVLPVLVLDTYCCKLIFCISLKAAGVSKYNYRCLLSKSALVYSGPSP